MKKIVCLMMSLLLCLPFSGCSQNKEPITLSVWHVYGGQTDSPLNDLIDEYNQGVGKDEGIQLVVTAVSNTNTIHDLVLSSVNGEPGAADLPDMFISYPKTVTALQDSEILVDYNDYFTEAELSAYLPEFVEEGTIDQRLLIFPTAKSAEILFVNKTLFDRFAADTGASLDDLATWEGLFETAERYTQWTDEQTEEEGDGKAFIAHDYPFNYCQVGVESLGESFFGESEGFHISSAWEQVWNPLAAAAVEGAVWLNEGYATDPLRTGEIISSVASSASVLYYKDIVTYADNTSEEVEIISLPCPVFENGEKLVMQRGAGFCTVKSSPEKEKAACQFLRWLTSPEINTRFVTAAGYMPVTQEAFDEYLIPALEQLEDAKYQSLYRAILETQQNYEFYTPPQNSDYLELEEKLEYTLRSVLSDVRRETEQAEQPEDTMLSDSYEAFVNALQ